MTQLFPKSFALLDSGDFEQLETFLDSARERLWDAPFGRHLSLQELANCGTARYALLERWAQKIPQSGYAHSVIAEYWSDRGAHWRGSAPGVSEVGAYAAAACSELAARWGIAGLPYARDKVFACNTLYELDEYLGLPRWTQGGEETIDLTFDVETLKRLSSAGYEHLPPVPDLPWPSDADPSEWLKEQAWAVRPDAYLPAQTEMHFLRPRWGGSIQEMKSLLGSKRFQALPASHIAMMQVWIDTDDVDGFVPDNLSAWESLEVDDKFDAVLESTTDPYARSQCLLLKASYLYHQEFEQEAADAVRLAMQTCSELNWDLAEYAHIIAINNPADQLVHKAGLAGFRAGQQEAMAALYTFEANCLPEVSKDRLAEIADHAMQCAGNSDNGWSVFCDDLSDIRQDWALDTLEAGAKAGLPDCYGTLARLYFNMQTPQAEERAQRFARLGVVKDEPMAHYVVAQIEMETATSDEARQALIRKMAALGWSDHGALELAIKWAAQYNSDMSFQLSLVDRAEEEGCDWAFSHRAYHYCYGVGTVQNRDAARDFVDMALDEDRACRLARRVRRSLRFPFIDWFGTPKKDRYM